MNLFATIIVGLIAGYVAHLIMKTKTGLGIDLILGIIGGVVGGWISTLLLGINLMSGVNLTSILVAIVGAIVVVFVYRLIARRR
jgi:uncharacterized membrane protein YeaQ/YmgE (transglycosylase-associated protein family)